MNVETPEMFSVWELQDGKELAEKIVGQVGGRWNEASGVLNGARITNIGNPVLFLLPGSRSMLVYELGGPDDVLLNDSVVLLEDKKVSFVFPETWPLRYAMGKNSALRESAESIRVLTISQEKGIERASIASAEASEVLKEASRRATDEFIAVLLKSRVLPAQDRGQ